jgi:3-methyladenine DNA glycosylase AlkC
MAEALKNLYSRELLVQLVDSIKREYPDFNKKAFLSQVFDVQWEQRELKQRMRHITHCMHQFLPLDYAQQVEILKKIAPAFSGFVAILFPDFVEVYGLDYPDISIPALELFTQYSSSEFAVRPFMLKYEQRMIQQHLSWAQHKNHHVRRLASEGIRPRLPWAMALPPFKKNPSAIFPILELLKNDPSEYVRRSVANNLNDISKDHPDKMLAIVKSWMGVSKETDWILKHASRGLLKKGHVEALSSFGINHKAKVEVKNLRLSKTKLAIGDAFSFTFTVRLTDKKAHRLRLEYKIYFVKSNGKTSPKIFQINTYKVMPGEILDINRTHRCANLTTRKHLPGKHTLAIVVNGKEYAQNDFIIK